MRIKDDAKQEAIIKATVKLVNEIGFVSASVSKIAKEANVSPATIYIYYRNKEDLLVSTYCEIKKSLGAAMVSHIDETKPFRDILHALWVNSFDYIVKNRDLLQYSEQFGNTPFSDLVDMAEIDKIFEPMYRLLQHAIDQKIIKNVPYDILIAFIFYPIMNLSNPKLCHIAELNDEIIEKAFQLAWDAIKL